jgi:hypothetical protein
VDKVDPSASNMPKHEPFDMAVVPGSVLLWQADPKPEEAERYYNFSRFTMGLNELKGRGKTKIVWALLWGTSIN